MQQTCSKYLGSISLLALAATFAPSAAAAAQDQNSGDEPIVITGSRIARPNYDTVEPAVILDSQQLEDRGFETLGQALNELPSFGVPGSSPVGGQAGTFGSGQSFVNFLGLGDQRTLTLVNGRRFISSNTSTIFGNTNAGGQVDLNQINPRLVDRVETIAVGGAPIYGSDAIAGTINVILKRDYSGLAIDAQYGVAERGDAPNYRVGALWGLNFAGGRGNVTISAEYNRGRGLVFTAREPGRSGRFYDDCPDGAQFNQCVYDNLRIPVFAEFGVPLVGGDIFGLAFPLSPQNRIQVFGDPTASFGVQDGQFNDLIFDRAGNLIVADYGAPIGNANTFTTNASGGNGFDINQAGNQLTDTKRYNVTLLANYQATDHIRLFAEGWFAYSRGTNLRDQPLYNSGAFADAGTPAGNLILSVDNPFLTPAARAAIVDAINNNPFSDQNFLGVPQDYFYFGRANTDLYSGRATYADTLTRGVLGADGDFGLLGRRWRWEAIGVYGRSHTRGHDRIINEQNFQNAVQAVAGPGGAITCAPGTVNSPFPTLSATCAPLNLFGYGRASQAAIDYILSDSTPTTTNTQYVFTADISGPLLRLPGGDLSVVLGYEHRREATHFEPGGFLFGGDDPDPAVDSNFDGDPTNDRVSFNQGVPILPLRGSYHTNELFGEVRADIVGPSNSIPAIYRLELQGAARYVHHSSAGGDLTWTAGGRWSPVRDLSFRGNFTRSIRAPSIQEAFNPSNTFFSFAVDPCDSNELGNGPAPATRQANCAAAGVDPNHQSTTNQLSFSQAIQGNPALANEKANAWTVGAVLTPRFIPGFSLSADYVDIRLRDAITNFSATQVLNACYDDAAFPANEFCPLIRRDAQDDLVFVGTRFFNADELRYKGILAALDYRFATPFLGTGSRMAINASYQYLARLTARAGADGAVTHNDGTLGYPRHSAVVNVSYEKGPARLFASFNYTGSVDQGTDEAPNFREHQRLGDDLFVNAGFSVNVSDRFIFHLSVDNLFDTGVPYPVPAFGGTITYFPGVLGRYYRAGASVRF